MTFTILLALSGLTLSGVAIYYSVIGLTAIFSAAFWPIVVMGTSLEVSKLVAASWLKANWARVPSLMKWYMSIAVVILMLITSMGIFGFLSKAHSDQSLVSGDVQSKIAIYDEKIKTARENIEANRKQLKQMDEAVDQVMARSSDEKGADKANAIRRSQQRDRVALAKDIEANQKLIATLNDEAAPIRAEIRKVEAEVGPIKYIAAFIYDESPDTNILEKAVTWVIITIIFVFDPLAVLMLLASQMAWQWHKEEKERNWIDDQVDDLNHSSFVADVGERPTAEEKAAYEKDDGPLSDSQIEQIQSSADTPNEPKVETDPLDQWNKMIAEAEKAVVEEKTASQVLIDQIPEKGSKGQRYRIVKDSQEIYFEHDGEKWNEISLEQPEDVIKDSKKKTYMIKKPDGSKKVLTIEDTSKTQNSQS